MLHGKRELKLQIELRLFIVDLKIESYSGLSGWNVCQHKVLTSGREKQKGLHPEELTLPLEERGRSREPRSVGVFWKLEKVRN